MLTKILDILNEEDLNYLEYTELTRELRLREDLQLDSLDQIQLVMALEDKFDIDIRLDEFFSVGELIDHLNKVS